MEGRFLDPSGGDGPGATDQNRMDDEFNDMQGMDKQYGNEEPFDETVEEQYNPDLSDNLPLERDSEAANNMAAGYSDETPEEDEGEGRLITADEVRGWDQKQTADHLRQRGVDPQHCDIIEQQEITGDVLLEMDQNSIISQQFDFGVMGKRLKTANKIRQFQQDVEADALRAQPAPIVEEAVEEIKIEGKDPLQSRSFKHPYTWRQGMVEQLQIDDTSDLEPVELLRDLEPKWADEDPTFLDTLTAMDSSGDGFQDVLASRKQAELRSKLSKDEVGGMERATSSMCADWFDKFNGHRKLNKYRARSVTLCITSCENGMLMTMLSPALRMTISSGFELECSNSSFAHLDASMHFLPRTNTQTAFQLPPSCN
jgi:SAM domain (Sterile alpha motif)